MIIKRVFKGPLAFPFVKICWMLILFLLMMGGCRSSFWLHRNRINTDNFASVKSSIASDIQGTFNKAGQEFERGEDQYEVNEGLYILRFEEDSGTTYDVLFVFTSRVRGFAGGFYYTPSGKLPPRAPEYGVVCSKHMEGLWYAFNAVDSQTPPDPKDCPEDTQYHR